MKYSVIIPAYESKDCIENTVNSVLTAGLTDFEIIIVNDGSKDGTAEICGTLAEKHPQVICINKENGGVSSARNRGIEASQGEYILFVDADDTFDTGALNNAAKIVEQYKPDMLIFGLSFDYYKNGSLYRRDNLAYPKECISEPEQWSSDFAELFECNALSPVWNKFYKSEIIKTNGLAFHKDIFIMEDFLFVLDCLKYTKTIYLLPEILYRYRQPEDEMRAYTRTNRIDNLNVYSEPFYNSMKSLEISLKEKYGLQFPEGEKVLFRLYSMLLSQKAYYADIDALKSLAEALKLSRWADYPAEDILITDLKEGNYRRILNRHKKIQLRHKIAVTIKKTKLFQALRGN